MATKTALKQKGSDLPPWYMVIGDTKETAHLAYAIFPTYARALRWIMENGRIGFKVILS